MKKYRNYQIRQPQRKPKGRQKELFRMQHREIKHEE